MNDQLKNPAIELLCAVIRRFPEKSRFDAVTWTAVGIGMSAEPTGLESTRERTIKQLYWDVTIDEVEKHLLHLVDTIHLDEELLILGVLGYLERYFDGRSTKESVQEFKRIQEEFLRKIDRDSLLPIEERRQRMSDDELRDFKVKVQGFIADADSNREKAAEALTYLRDAIQNEFTENFWREFKKWRSARDLGKLGLDDDD